MLIRLVQVSGFDGNGIFSAKITINKSFISVLKKFWVKKMLKNFVLMLMCFLKNKFIESKNTGRCFSE